MEKHKKDYCGECLFSFFRNEAVIPHIDAVQGTERNEDYEVTFDVMFRETGFVSLAAAKDYVESVECSTGRILIEFKHPLSAGDLSTMFPADSLLVVDGLLFDIDCDVGDQDNPDTLMESGFLIIETAKMVSADGGHIFVAVKGIPASYMYLFDEQSLSYDRLDGESQDRGLDKATSDDKIYKETSEDKFTWKEKGSGFAVELGYKVTASASSKTLRQYWKARPVEIDFLYTFSFQLDIELAAKIALLLASKEIKPKPKELEKIRVQIPGAEFQLPGAVIWPLHKMIPVQLKAAAGLFFSVPFAVTLKGKTKAKVAFELKEKLTSGMKTIAFGLKGKGMKGKGIDIEPVFKMVENKQFQLLPSDNPKLPNLQAELTLDAFAGVKPKLIIEAIGE